MAIASRKRIRLNLALQGGGAHGAFTWGVLDQLLGDDRVKIACIGAASAGAVNAVAVASGMAAAGPEGARDKLRRVWEAIHKAGVPEFQRFAPLFPGLHGIDHLATSSYRQLSNVFSPYSLNPLGFNPLGSILAREIDFALIRRQPPFPLLIAATNALTGQARFFRSHEVSVETVLASACLPTLHQAVEIDGVPYWDGGFSANPDLVQLADGKSAGDTLVILLNPIRLEEVPTTAAMIANNVSRLTFNQPFLRDVAILDGVRRACGPLKGGGHRLKRLRRQRFHLIEAGAYTSQLAPDSKMKPEWRLLSHLHQAGFDEAEQWSARHLRDIGRRETANLPKLFLDN